MLHCCQFKADDIYHLNDTDLFSSRVLSVGFCPVCKKPVAELTEWRFDGIYNKQSASGLEAQEIMIRYQNDIAYSVRETNYRKAMYKPYGWKYGLNRSKKNGDVRQYACDFYGNKELIKG